MVIHPVTLNDFGEDLPRRFPLVKDKGGKFVALVNEKGIINTAHILQTIAINVQAERESLQEETVERKLKNQVSIKGYLSRCFGKVIETLDIVLEWLEESSKQVKDEIDKKEREKSQSRPQTDETDASTEEGIDGQTIMIEYQEKKDGVLRGLYNITDLGSFTCRIDLLELACKFLDLPENPYAAKREHVKECLRQVEEQKEQVFELIEKACNLLQETTEDSHVNQSKATEFNRIVRQANVLIKSCNDFLSSADETIDELLQIMSTMKIFSRVVRSVGFGLTCFGLYQINLSLSTVESLTSYIPSIALSLINDLFPAMKYFTFTTACAVSGYAWLSFFPSKVYGFRDDLAELKLRHKRLTLEINRLDQRLKML